MIINREDKITTHVYDARYNCLSTTYSDGTIESYSYDDRGNQITFIDRASVSTSYGYNDLGQRIRIHDALGGMTQYVYKEVNSKARESTLGCELGNCITIFDPEERITQFEYDSLSRLISITDNAQKTIFFHYDKAERKSALVDPLGNTTRYIYDENGFLRTEIAPDARQKHYAYDRGLLTSITREDGAKYSFSYDKKRHRLSKSIGNKTTHYTYDTLGNILTIDDGVNKVEYVYDINANVLLERLGNESVSYAYNSDGTKRFIGYADAHYRLVRDESGNLIEIRKGLESYSLKYDPLGNQTALTYPNRFSQKSQFDPLGRIAKRSWGENEPLAYTYDKSSRIVMKNTTPYRYDEAGRVVSAGDEDYHYDEAGNLLRGESTIDSVSGRLMRQGEVEFSYDPLGRLIVKRSPITQSIYSYDAEGYLVRYVRTPVRPEEIKNIVELRFTYDPLGRRLTKHFKSFVVSSSNHETINEYHHRYLYAGDNIVAIYDADTDQLIATLLHDEGIDTPLSISVYPTAPLSSEEQYRYDSLDESEQYLFRESRIQTYYYHRDHQNSILSLTDREGKIVESYSYDPYGTIIHSTKTVETYNPYGYTGREINTDDLYYYRARYYDPTIGRFITPNPIGFLGGDTNFYRYVGNDPVNFRDPSGLFAFSEYLNLLNPTKSNFAFFDSDNSVIQPTIPNSNIPKIRTATQIERHKKYEAKRLSLAKQKAAAPMGINGAIVKGNVEKKVDEKCKDQKWFDPIKDPQLAMYTKGGGKAPHWNVFGTVRNGKMHAGVDLLAMPGTNVYACVDCTVQAIDYLKPSHKGGANYGWYIYLKAKCPTFVRSQKKAYSLPYKKQGEMEKEAGFKDDGDFYFFYAHLIKIDTIIHKAFKNGEKVEVKAGDKIGKTGTSGYDTSADPHLHFEVRCSNNLKKGSNNRVNPGFYMKYKLPDELKSDESASQKEIAKKQQVDPSPKK